MVTRGGNVTLVTINYHMEDKETNMKKVDKGRMVVILMGIAIQIYFFFPWIEGAQKKYNGFSFLYAMFRRGSVVEFVKQEFPKCIQLGGNTGVFAFQFTLVVIMVVIAQMVALIILLGAIKRIHIRFGAGIISVLSVSCFFVIQANTSASWDETYISNRDILTGSTYVYPLLMIFVSLILIVVLYAVQDWKEAALRAQEEREQRKAYRRERRKRLYFPGRYSKLYYRIWWKDLRFRWKDMTFLFLSVFLSALFLFVGLGVYRLFSGNYGEDGGMLGLGLTEIMGDFLIVIVFIALFLIAFTLSFYQRRKKASIGMIQTLGIRSRALYTSWFGELLGCFVTAVLSGLIAGTVVLLLLCQGFAIWMPDYQNVGFVNYVPYVRTLCIMFAVCVSAYMFSKEYGGGSMSTDTRNETSKWEKVSGKYTVLATIVSVALAIVCLVFYRQRRMAESMLLSCGFLFCIMNVLRGAWGVSVAGMSKYTKNFIPVLVKNYRIRYRFQTLTRYISLLMFLNVFVLSVFGMKFVSAQSAANPKELFPYDYVYLACSQDEAYFQQLEAECEANIVSVPMVRATTLDNTERPEQFREIVEQQGQNIGISESTYRQLKKLKGEPAEALHLDRQGKNIHVVYQQDESSKAKPLDWYQWTSTPYVHIGQALYGQNIFTRRETYPPRNISGEERESLIGAYRQGKYENLIVFSDEYFEQVKDCWKTTNLMTGEYVPEDMAIPDVTIHEWPTQLKLVNVPESYQSRADEILAGFREAHAFDEDFDPLVKSAYVSKDAMHQRQMERRMETLVNGMILLMLTVVGLFLLRIKIKMDMQELEKDYRFFEVFGMSEKERINLMKMEISRLVWVPLVVAMAISVIFTGIVFKLRLYDLGDMMDYVKYGAVLWGVYFVVQLVNLKMLQRQIVNRLEKVKL